MQKIQGFNVGRLLGQGAFGSVYTATATRKTANFAKGEELAIKTFFCISQYNRVEVAAMAAKEFALMRTAASPNVLRALQLLKRGGHQFLVMELGASSLAMMLNARGTLTVPESKCIVLGLGKAMVHLHDCRVMHRDIKPDNVIMVMSGDGSLTPKLTDFGLAHRIKEGKSPSDFPGSPMYMAPEVKMMHHHDEKCDVFSYGITVYECLVASFDASPTESVAPSLPDLLMELLVKDCLRTAPSDRPTAEQILDHPAFAHFFIPSALPMTSLNDAPDLELLKVEERRKHGAALQWRLERVEEVVELATDSARKLVACAIYEVLFVSPALREIHIASVGEHSVVFEIRKHEDQLAGMTEADGTIDLLFPVGGALRIKLLAANEPLHERNDPASPPPQRRSSERQNREAVTLPPLPPVVPPSSQQQKDPASALAPPVLLDEPAVGAPEPSQRPDVVGSAERRLRCGCGKIEPFSKMCMCYTCTERHLPGGLTDPSTPLSALESHFQCTECSAAHLLKGHECLDAGEVELRKKEASIDRRHKLDKRELRKTIRALKRRLDKDEQASTATTSLNLKRHVRRDILSRKESLASATRTFLSDIQKLL